MKQLLFLLLFGLVCISNLHSQSKDSITVYVFLLEDCVISQNYTRSLKKIYEQYAPKGIAFLGVFPNRISNERSIQAFKDTYQLPFEMKYDYFQTLTKSLNATVTPQVVVFNHSDKAILYSGRIDNTYARVGQRRQVTTASELEDVLEAIVLNKPIPIKQTQPIGCYILFESN